MTAVAGHTRSAKSPRHSNMEDGRALPASVPTAEDHLTECTPTTQSVPMSRLNVRDAMMFVPREMALTSMTTQRLDPNIQHQQSMMMVMVRIGILLQWKLIHFQLLHILYHLLILRTVLRSKEDVFAVLIMENALDTQAQTPHHGSEQSSHHASILMDIFNVTLVMTALKCPMEGWFVVKMVATVQRILAQIQGIHSVDLSVMVMVIIM